MKSINPHFLFVFLFALCCSCADSDDDNSATKSIGKYRISGTFTAPNSNDPITQGKATLWQNDAEIAQTQTNAEGVFEFTQLQAGDYELSLTKGHFSSNQPVSIESTDDASTSINIGNIPIQNFPNIGVVTGTYDNIEHILYDIGLVNPLNQEPLFDIIDGDAFGSKSANSRASHHQEAHSYSVTSSATAMLQPNVNFSLTDLLNDPAKLAQYDILFFNCGLNTSEAFENTNLYDYVVNGGILYATDWAYPFIEQINSLETTDYLTFQNPYKSGISLTTDASILNPNLSNWLNTNFGISANGVVTIDEFLGSWQVVETHDDDLVIPWLNGSVEYNDGTANVTQNKYLAFTYLVGDGGVFYSSFHTENEESGFTEVDRIMEYMVFELSAFNQ